MNWKDKEVLIIGGTGSLGKALIKKLLEKNVGGIRIYSRDELKQSELKKKYNKNVAYLIGDVRNEKRLTLAMKGCNIVIHAAAMKQVPACEEHPMEAIQTNVIGAQNVLSAALQNNVEKVMNISTDKAVYPVNLYGATKMCAEKLFINGNVYSGGRKPIFSCCRYGNVINSRGSVIPLFLNQIQKGLPVTITDENMTRFLITLDTVTTFITDRIENMQGGEIFIPKMPSMFIKDIAECLFNSFSLNKETNFSFNVIGIRQGEKLHETMLTKEESETSIDMGHYFEVSDKVNRIKSFVYSSDNNDWWLKEKEFLEMLK